MPTPQQNLQAAYASSCQALAAMYANPKPNYSIDGVSYSWDTLRGNLLKEQAELLTAIQNADGPFEARVYPIGS